MSNFSFQTLKGRVTLTLGLGIFLLTASLVVASRRTHEGSPSSLPAPNTPRTIAGPGRVEPSSEDIKIGSELSGRLKVVNVEEGDAIQRGQAERPEQHVRERRVVPVGRVEHLSGHRVEHAPRRDVAERARVGELPFEARIGIVKYGDIGNQALQVDTE